MSLDYKKARETLGLKLREVAKLSGWGVGTISDLEREGVGSDRLKDKLMEVYGLSKIIDAPAVPVETELEIWRRRARTAELQLADLRAELRRLADPGQPSSRLDQIAGSNLETHARRVPVHPKVPRE